MTLGTGKTIARRAGGMAAIWAAGAIGLARAGEAETLTSLPIKEFLKNHYMETLGLIPAATLLALLAAIVHIDPYIRAEHKRIMRAVLVAVFSLVAQNFLEYRLQMGETRTLARTLASIYGYAVRPLILVLFLRLTRPEKPVRWAWALVGMNAAAHATALFSHVCFWIDEHNHYQGGPLNRMCLYVSAILLIYWSVMTIRMLKPHRWRETLLPALALAMIVCGVALDSFVGLILQPVTYQTIFVVISCVTYYVWLHLQFVQEHEQALVAGQRVQLMLSQIKPHFLYNALGTIEGLCITNPAEARAATVKFAQYLRGNMDSLSQRAAIPFERELAHTKLYLELEKLRFEDDLTVKYDIACADSEIPTLTLEPIVENAVRHGVRKNPDGRGTVTIATRETEERYEVTVTDDGPGFDPGALLGDGESHVGLRNVRERLGAQGGWLDIRSEPGKGARASIILPKDRGAAQC